MATILTKKSDTASAVPLAADLTNAAGGAELAVNATDKRLFSKTSGGTVVELGTNPSTLVLPSGSANGVTYLNGSKVVTSGSALTFDGTALQTSAARGTYSLKIYNGSDGSVAGNFGALSGNVFAIDATGPANTMTFLTGGSEQMRLTSTGLGIGTSSPSAKLHVSGDALANTFKLIANTTVSGSDATIFRPADNTMAFSTNGAERMRLDSSGNLGLGVTPSAWISAYKALEIGTTTGLYGRTDSTMEFALALNSYRASSGSWIYRNTGAAARYNQNSGAHWWDIAASGTAGNAITFTQAMTLSAAGLLGVGVTSPEQRIHLPNNSGIRLGDAGATPKADINYSSSGLEFLDIKVQGTTTGYGNIRFYTGATPDERARIDSSGNLLVGTTTTRGKITSEQSGGDWALGINHTNAGTQSFTAFRYAGTLIGQITGNNTNTSYTTSSDYRLKNTIAPMTGALAKVALLKPCTYKWNVDGSDGEGFIAHELAEVCPQAVNGEKDAVDEEGNPKYQGIDTSFLVATLTAALQELKAEFDAYKASHP